MRVGVLSNPGSERNRRGMAAIGAVIDRSPEILHLQFRPKEGFAPPLRRFAAAGIELLVINSGDGTVHGVLTELFANRPFATPPLVAVLPRGMANMTAADCGLKGGGAETLERLLAACRRASLAPHRVTRHVLKVDYADGKTALRGMFFGAAGIVDAIELAKGKVHKQGIKGEWSHAVTLGGLLIGTLFRGFEAMGLRPHRIGIQVDEAERQGERLLLLIATTLDRLVLCSRPFWNTGGKPIRHTRINHPPRRLLRHSRRILYGRPDRRLPETDFRSGGAERLALWLDSPFTIDGEFFTAEPGRPVVVTADETIDFIRL